MPPLVAYIPHQSPLMVVNSEKKYDSPKPKPSRSQWLRKALLDVTPSEYDILALSTAFKVLLFPT